MKNNIFDYVSPKYPDDAIHVISPSSIYKFFDYPKVWYEENILNNKTFEASTATLTGTICHYIYEQVSKGLNVTREEINEQLDTFLNEKQLPDIDKDKIISDYPAVANIVVNNYVLPHTTGYGVVAVERPIIGKVFNKIYVGGTVDRIEGDCIVDYKTVGIKPNETQIPFNYKIQLLAYAFILRQLGWEINRIRIVYGIKPLKTIGARCIVVTESITYEDEKLIKNTLQLIGESIIAIKEKPELTHLIFKSMDLKE